MRYEPSGKGKTFGLSAIIGAYAGVALHIALAAWREPFPVSEWRFVPLLAVFYGLLALPFVALGLAVFGLPATALLRPRANDWWVGLIAASWGTMAGKLTFFAIDHLLFFGLYDIGKVAFFDLGVIYGAPTGLAWWALFRRRLACS